MLVTWTVRVVSMGTQDLVPRHDPAAAWQPRVPSLDRVLYLQARMYVQGVVEYQLDGSVVAVLVRSRFTHINVNFALALTAGMDLQIRRPAQVFG